MSSPDDVHPLTILEAESQGVRWAIWCGLPPPIRRDGCPPTGWVHEGGPPWRVIVARDPFTLPRLHTMERRPYTGTEPAVDVAEWLAQR